MTNSLTLSIAVDRSLAWAEGSSVRYIVATLEGERMETPQSRPAPPVNLALVIDASCSMAGDKLDNAKRAARGVAKRLREGDALSIVSFASDVVVHVDAMAITSKCRNEIGEAIDRLTARGCTNLSDGWFTGAERVAKASEEPGVNRIILLSDGAANEGVVDPDELARHARELAKRGIVTSCVGIGDGYEAPLLQAIAEHGGGRVHDAEFGADIVDALMGELGEIGDLAAQDVSITLHVPASAKAEFVGSAPAQVGAGLISVLTGGLLVGRPRSCIFRVTLPAGRIEETLLFGVGARGTGLDGAPIEARPVEAAFTLVEGARNNRQRRDETASMAVATVWHTEILRAAARLNRSGERRQARRYVERELQFFERYCSGLPQAAPLLKEIALLRQNVDRDWDERTRKEMEVAAYRVQANRADYRGARASWSERLNGDK
jgi:Ca-activated chloride channel family protein